MGIRNIDALKPDGEDEIPTNSVNPCGNRQPHDPHEWGRNGRTYNCNGR
jgi:hypothetical protein